MNKKEIRTQESHVYSTKQHLAEDAAFFIIRLLYLCSAAEYCFTSTIEVFNGLKQ